LKGAKALLQALIKRQAKEWVQILRKKWKIRDFRVGRDGSVKYGDFIFASVHFHEDFAWWEILTHSSPEIQTLFCPAFFMLERRYLCIAEQVLPEAERKATQYFLTLALIHHILHTKFSRMLHNTAIRVVYDQYIEFSVGEWKAVGKKQADYYLRFPLVDETTDPDDYSVYFVIYEVARNELQPIPYKQLLELEHDDFLRLAALTTL
jgi:hypothetical protein